MNRFKMTLVAAASLALISSSAFAVDVEALMKDSKCFKCHAPTKDKDGPSFHKTAEKYKGKADAEQKLITHITTGPKYKVDGEEQEHAKIKTTDAGDLKAVVEWMLKQ